MPEPPRFDPDLEWLDLVRPVGLVVAPSLLKELGLAPQLQTRADNAAVAELLRPRTTKARPSRTPGCLSSASSAGRKPE